MKTLYKRNEVEAYIKLKFKNNEQCSEALGISPATFSRNLNRLTLNFIQRLREVGVPIPYPDERIRLKVSEPDNDYNCCEVAELLKQELLSVKAENYDLHKKIDNLEKRKGKKDENT